MWGDVRKIQNSARGGEEREMPAFYSVNLYELQEVPVIKPSMFLPFLLFVILFPITRRRESIERGSNESDDLTPVDFWYKSYRKVSFRW
eukprot:2754895-Ditylum_brightwellii.AAC.2